MKIKLTKYILKDGSVVIDNDYSYSPYSTIEKEYEQEIEVNEENWVEVKDE